MKAKQERIKQGKELSARIMQVNEERILEALKEFDEVESFVYSCEGVSGELEDMLDFAGIDLIVKKRGDLLGGVAFRTNFTAYETLTLRDNGGHQNTQLQKLMRAQKETEAFLQAVYYVQLNGVNRETLELEESGNILIATASTLYNWISSLSPEDWNYLYKEGDGWQMMRVPSESYSYWSGGSPLYRYSVV